MWSLVAFASSVAMMVALLVRGTRTAKRLRGPTASWWPIAEMPDGEIGRAIGEAKPIAERTLEAPLTGRRCLYYHLRILRSVQDRGDHTLLEEAAGVEFGLTDASARAVVDPHRAVCALQIAKTEQAYGFQLAPAMLGILRRANHRVARHAIYVLQESRIEPDDKIAVTARADRREGGLCLAGSPKEPVVLSDDTKVPRISLPRAQLRS